MQKDKKSLKEPQAPYINVHVMSVVNLWQLLPTIFVIMQLSK